MLWCALPLASYAQRGIKITQKRSTGVCKKSVKEEDVDYYVRSTLNFWEFFVDAYPMQGWEHDCYVYYVPKTYTSSTPVISSEHRTLPPTTGDFTPIEVKTVTALMPM